MLSTLKRKITLKLFTHKRAKSSNQEERRQLIVVGSFLGEQHELFIHDNLYSWLNVKDAKSLSSTCSFMRRIFTCFYRVDVGISSELIINAPITRLPFQKINSLQIQVETPKDYEMLLAEELFLNWECVKNLKLVFHCNSRPIAVSIGPFFEFVFSKKISLEKLVIQNKIRQPSELSRFISESIISNIPTKSIGKLINELPSDLGNLSKLSNNLILGSRFNVSSTEINLGNLENFKCILEGFNIGEFSNLMSNPSFCPTTLDLYLNISTTNFISVILNHANSERVQNLHLSGEADGRLMFYEICKFLKLSMSSLTIHDTIPHKFSIYHQCNFRNRIRQVSIEITQQDINELTQVFTEGSSQHNRMLIACDSENTMSQLSDSLSHIMNCLPVILYLVVKRHVVEISSNQQSRYIEGIKIRNKRSSYLSKRELLNMEEMSSLVLTLK